MQALAESCEPVFAMTGKETLRVSSAILFTNEQRMATLKCRKINEFSKLSTKSCISRTMNNRKESFTLMKAITTRTTILKY